MTARYDSGDVSPEPLAQPLQFLSSGRTAKNRFCKSPMGEVLATWNPKNFSEGGVPTKQLIDLYRRWGEGKDSWGIIVTGNIATQWDSPNAPGDMLIGPDAQAQGERFERFKDLAAGAKANGSLIIGQISHPGRQVLAKINPVAVSASDVQLAPNKGMSYGKPHAATKEEIAHLVEGFAHAAEYLEKAGFDGIELHGAHGYLISQFLSRSTNLRTDEYGIQNTENRLRFLTEIVIAIKARVTPGFIISAKLNSVEFQEGGVTPDEAREVCETLETLGLDFVELSGGTYENNGMRWEKESSKIREAFFIEFAETVIKALGDDRKLKVYIAGGLRSVGAMVNALKVVDGVTLGRPAAAEPRLSSDILQGRVRGALKPIEPFESEFGMGSLVAMTQISQTANGKEPLRSGDPVTMVKFREDLGKWFQAIMADGNKMEVVGGVKFTGPETPYGEVVAQA
ncbi:related to NADH oxidase [Cephalotrichum gorgonifer]|uniref:Related to NADH oxidase n=1 Tax=Cephalotrichum gorgonifer TaxID=2041049 RepID=A0AAE8MXA0_9PEZI|nr:related to NADH oxidase [Cephalotrichum gorgonifer]